MDTLIDDKTIITACTFQQPLTYTSTNPLLAADATATAWWYNNPTAIHWIIRTLSTPERVWATIVSLMVANPTAVRDRLRATGAALLYLDAKVAWNIVCYPVIPHPIVIETIVQIFPLTEIPIPYAAIWHAAWQTNNPRTAEWALKHTPAGIASFPLQTVCVFRKSYLDNEGAESMSLATVRELLRTIINDASIHSLVIDLIGGYRRIMLEWQLPGRNGRRRRHIVKYEDIEIPRFHKSLAPYYNTHPADTMKLLFMGVPPSFSDRLICIFETMDAINAQLIITNDSKTEKSREDDNKLMKLAANYINRYKK